MNSGNGAAAPLRVTAIVPATDGPATLAMCEAAIAGAADPPDEVRVLTLRPGAGPSAARNAGAAETEADVLVFVDADVAVHPDAFTRIRAAFAADPDLTAVFGSYDDSPAGPGLVSSFRNLLHHHVHQSSAGEVGTFWAGLGAIRRDAFLAGGGFDAGRFSAPSMEDVELGMRLADGGARIELDPLLLGKHLKSWSLLGMIRTDVSARGIPWVALLMRRRSVPSELNLAWRHRVSAAAWILALASVLRRRPAAAAASVAIAAAPHHAFYALLRERLGTPRAIVCVGLHGLHYLCATAAIPLGAIAHVRERTTVSDPDESRIAAAMAARGLGRFAAARAEPDAAPPLAQAGALSSERQR